MTGRAASDSTRATSGFRLPTEAWAIDAARLRHVTETLDALPVGFAVFHEVALPRPSTEYVDHLVIGPRGAWAVTVATFDEPITAGSGRGSDTLWSGRTPLRSLLAACETRADTLAALIDHPVEPLLCIAAPSIAADATDAQAVSICSPDDVADAVAVATTGWHDVGSIASTVERELGAEPARRSAVPTLRRPSLPPTGRGARATNVGQLAHRARRRFPIRRVVLLAALVVALTAVPNLLGLGTTVAQRGVEIGVDSVSDVLTPSTLVTEAASGEPSATPPDVRYVVTCPSEGAGWTVSWAWPGDLPDGVAAYGVRTRVGDGSLRNQTPESWTTRADEPITVGLDTAAGDATVRTEYRDAVGAVIGFSERPFQAPAQSC